jgi:hypothetical protein
MCEPAVCRSQWADAWRSRSAARSCARALVRFARRRQMVDRVVERLLDDEMHTTAGQRPVNAADGE